MEAAGGEAAFISQKKTESARRIAHAQLAPSDPTIDEEDRLFYQLALEKAQRMLDAESMEDYVEATVMAKIGASEEDLNDEWGTLTLSEEEEEPRPETKKSA